MPPEFTKDLFLQALDEWKALPADFRRLSPDERAGFLKDQGYASLKDLLAHAAVWWEEAEGIVRDTTENRERPPRKYDFDEFNAASLARFKDTPEAEFMDWYESMYQRFAALIASLTDEQMKIRRVRNWLNGVTLEHIKEHGLTAPRFLVLDTLQREWEGYLERFNALPEDKQKEFLQKQGFPQLRDLLAHIIAWWEDGMSAIHSYTEDASYKHPEKDTDEFNAEAVKKFAKLDEAEARLRFESTRQSLIELVTNLPEEILNHKDVQAWLRADVIEHYFEHAV